MGEEDDVDDDLVASTYKLDTWVCAWHFWYCSSFSTDGQTVDNNNTLFVTHLPSWSTVALMVAILTEWLRQDFCSGQVCVHTGNSENFRLSVSRILEANKYRTLYPTIHVHLTLIAFYHMDVISLAHVNLTSLLTKSVCLTNIHVPLNQSSKHPISRDPQTWKSPTWRRSKMIALTKPFDQVG